MNAEFVEKMLEAKRLEAQALALLVPEGARQVAAGAVRVCSAVALAVLDAPASGASTAETRAGESKAAPRTGPRSGVQSIVIE